MKLKIQEFQGNNTPLKNIKNIAFVMVAMLLSFSAFPQRQAKRIENFNLNNKVGIQGYDPVAYFKQHKAVKGKKEIASAYQGVTYYFASQADKDAFAKTPTAYEPQYGGWCAFSMGDSGDKVSVDPATFKITDGKLYLFYNQFFNNTLNAWSKDEPRLRKKADENWMKIIK